MRQACLFAALVFGCGAAYTALSSEPTPAKPYTPKIDAASDQAEKALRRIRVPRGLKVTLFAAEPMLANPVCFCVDA